MSVTRPCTRILLPGASLRLVFGDDLADVGDDAAEVAALHVGEDVVDGLDVEMARGAGAVPRSTVATLPRSCGSPFFVAMGVRRSASVESTRCTGVFTATRYGRPATGSTQ
jgi:hypothetical protein